MAVVSADAEVQFRKFLVLAALLVRAVGIQCEQATSGHHDEAALAGWDETWRPL